MCVETLCLSQIVQFFNLVKGFEGCDFFLVNSGPLITKKNELERASEC